MSSDPLVHDKSVKTAMNCTNCSKGFVAELDYQIDGNHVVLCPYCGHEHCRVIKDGVVTGDRWESRKHTVKIERSRVWKHDVLQMKTTSAADLIRARWLETIT